MTADIPISRLVLEGFKSIKSCDLELGAINVLIGANGAGKSNFVSFFRLIQQMLEGNFQTYVGSQGGPDALLHYGRKTTESLKIELRFCDNGYAVTFQPTQGNQMMFAEEAFLWNMSKPKRLGRGHFETLAHKGTGTGIDSYVLPQMRQWRVYHFHDTSESALVKQTYKINDNLYLRPDARNLASFLLMLKEQHYEHYQKIVKTIQLVAPFFGDFLLRPTSHNKDMIELEWVEKGQDSPFKAHYLSDGTLRFICLATVLLQPPSLQPATIIIDEPELGLHPYAIVVLGALIRSASKNRQIILTTQSVELLNEFKAEDIIVVDRVDGASTLTRLDAPSLSTWLQEYSLGDLWKKNILGGRPSR